MILKKAKKEKIEKIQTSLTDTLLKDPLFMYFCPNVEKRIDFINAYLKYYIYEWTEYDTLLCSSNRDALISLVNPRTFEYKFKGKGAHALKKIKTSDNIFTHRKNVRKIVHIVAPGTTNPRVMTIYGNPATAIDSIKQLVDEAIEFANNNGNTLVYETLSIKLIPIMEEKGFTIAYQKQYLNTRFVETLMTFSPKIEKPAKKEIL